MDLESLKEVPPWEWPSNAAKEILKSLRNERAEGDRRLLAAELAGDLAVTNDTMASALLTIARNRKEPEDLRILATLSLGPVLDYTDTLDLDDPDDAEEMLISKKTFHKILQSLHELYLDPDISEELRRKVLEASVHAHQDWHPDAIRDAYSGDEQWMLTAVFCMQYVPGFEKQILDALEDEDEGIHFWAICAAGNWQVDGAWEHVSGLVTAKGTEKPLLLAAIEATAAIRPHEAPEVLAPLLDSKDEDIVEAVEEALIMAEELSESGDHDDEEIPF